MASLEEHCADCIKELGDDFEGVHKYLDEFMASKGPGHRVIRHHVGGVEEIRKKWGDRAAKAAEIHIKKDWWGKVPTRKEAEIWCTWLL